LQSITVDCETITLHFVLCALNRQIQLYTVFSAPVNGDDTVFVQTQTAYNASKASINCAFETSLCYLQSNAIEHKSIKSH